MVLPCAVLADGPASLALLRVEGALSLAYYVGHVYRVRFYLE